MENSKLDETLWIDKARRGDVQAFSALVELTQERAIRVACGFVGNLEDARDLAQEAFVKAYESLASFEGQSRFYTWFYRILTNTCKDFLRKKKLRQTFSLWSVKEEGEEETPVEFADGAKNAYEHLADKESGAAISVAIQKLPFQQRLVFVLRYLDGLSLEEISTALGISVGAVKAHLWQAGQKMKYELKETLR